jgi:hypothetical protein
MHTYIRWPLLALPCRFAYASMIKQECEQHFSCDLRPLAKPGLNQFSALKPMRAVGMRGRDRMFHQCCSCCTVATRPLTCLVFEVRFSYKATDPAVGEVSSDSSRGIKSHATAAHSPPPTQSTHNLTPPNNSYPAIARFRSSHRDVSLVQSATPRLQLRRLSCNQASSRSLSPQPSD